MIERTYRGCRQQAGLGRVTIEPSGCTSHSRCVIHVVTSSSSTPLRPGRLTPRAPDLPHEDCTEYCRFQHRNEDGARWDVR